MNRALVLTVWSAVVYFYHAREVIAGPWSPSSKFVDGGTPRS